MDNGICTTLRVVAQGLSVITTSHMARRAIQLGGKHIAYLFGLPHNKFCTPQRRAELALQKIIWNAILNNFIKTLDCLFVDEMGQSSCQK